MSTGPLATWSEFEGYVLLGVKSGCRGQGQIVCFLFVVVFVQEGMRHCCYTLVVVSCRPGHVGKTMQTQKSMLIFDLDRFL